MYDTTEAGMDSIYNTAGTPCKGWLQKVVSMVNLLLTNKTPLEVIGRWLLSKLSSDTNPCMLCRATDSSAAVFPLRQFMSSFRHGLQFRLSAFVLIDMKNLWATTHNRSYPQLRRNIDVHRSQHPRLCPSDGQMFLEVKEKTCRAG